MKRNLLIIPGAFMLLLLSCQQGPEQPNIVFIMADDHAYQAISAYRSGLNETPNIDRLAEEGMIFNRAFVTNSICAPSRAVILTGKYSHLNGVLDNRLPFDTSQVTYPRILQEHGYQTAMIGKWHLKTEPKGFNFWKVLPGQGNYYNPDFRTPDGNQQIEGYVTDIITDMALDWLKNKRNPDKPFLLVYQHKAPHRSWWPGPDHLTTYENTEFPEPPNLFDDYKTRGRAAREQEMTILDYMNLHGDLKIKPEDLDSINPDDPWEVNAYKWSYNRFNKEQRRQWDEVYDKKIEDFMAKNPAGDDLLRWKYQRYMQDYLACIASVDDNVGRILDYLDETGLAENTIVVYTSDQGFYLGEHGWFDKRFMYRESFRTPLIIRWPGKIEPGSACDEMVLNLDFAETFLDIANVEIPRDMQGTSLTPLFTNGKAEDWRKSIYYHYYEYPAVHQVKRHYGIRTERYKLIHFYYDIDEWELYDIQQDPVEMNNLFGQEGYDDITAGLKEQLKKLQEKYGESDKMIESFLPENNPE